MKTYKHLNLLLSRVFENQIELVKMELACESETIDLLQLIIKEALFEAETLDDFKTVQGYQIKLKNYMEDK